ncbi:hypothetical protein [Candidatus Paracaedibacter symbiosus]|uniref:hypothetical protein n=1 Tax=Candidatus Paracaedibacter symbiosus TaxID=244582 RepID=UPI000509E439|nr:hypothetical protein [Candidatus Paracaedibacter symbiosus]
MLGPIISTLILVCCLSPLTVKAMELQEGRKRSMPTSNGPCKLIKITSPEPTDFTEELGSRLSHLCLSIHKAYKDASEKGIEQAYSTFTKLTTNHKYTPDHWHQVREESNKWVQPPFSLTLYQWPCQANDQEVIGGHLFYPPDLNKLLDSYYTKHLLQRNDFVAGLAIATKYHNSLATYYLTSTLDEMSLESTEKRKEDSDYFRSRYKHALEELEQCQDHPDAYYVLGENYAYGCKGGIFILGFNTFKAYELFEKGQTPRNKLAALQVRHRYIVDFPIPPTLEEYLTLATKEEGYGLAYIKAADLVKDEERKLSYLQDAVKLAYYPALIEKGIYFEQKGCLKEAMEYYEEAGRNGVTYGYIQCGELVGGRFPPLTLGSKIKYDELAALPEEKVNQARGYFEAAGKANDPEGWAYLAKYCMTLLVPDALKGHKEHEQEFRAQALMAIEQGVKLGSPDCFMMARGFPEQYNALIKAYGPATYGSYYKHIEKTFLK